MSKDKILRAMNNVDERFIEEASIKEALDGSKLEESNLEESNLEESKPEGDEDGQFNRKSYTGKTGTKEKKHPKRFSWVRWAGPIAAVLAIVLATQISGGPFSGRNEATEAAIAEDTATGGFMDSITAAEESTQDYPTAAENAEPEAAIAGESAAEAAASNAATLKNVPEKLGLQKDEPVFLGKGTSAEESDGSAAADTEESMPGAGADASEQSRNFAYIPDTTAQSGTGSSAVETLPDVDDFAEEAARVFLAGRSENCVCSPSNIYMALAMLAEVTGGSTRSQILDALDADSIGELRKEAAGLYRSCTLDDGSSLMLTGNSLWCRNDFDYKTETLELLRDRYYAYSYAGEMGSVEMDQCYRDWLSTMTKGLLDKEIGQESLTADTVLALASTLYYKSSWISQFNTEMTGKDIFHGSRGDTETDFMHSSETGILYKDEENTFTAVSLNLAEGTMWFVLPEEGVSTDQVLRSETLYELAADPADCDDCTLTRARIDLSVPKFDVTCKQDLVEGLRKLGITKVFQAQAADFSPLTSADGCYVSSASHAARLKIDEEGVEAAAYTAFYTKATGIISETVVFSLNRPFVFLLTNDDGVILFEGVISNLD